MYVFHAGFAEIRFLKSCDIGTIDKKLLSHLVDFTLGGGIWANPLKKNNSCFFQILLNEVLKVLEKW